MSPNEIQAHGFENLSAYESIIPIIADSPIELAKAISSIKAPIKILGFTNFGTKQVCYILTNGFKIKKTELKNSRSK